MRDTTRHDTPPMDDLDAELVAALAALPREPDDEDSPTAGLEERVTARLRAESLLAAPRPWWRRFSTPGLGMPVWATPLAAMAGVVLAVALLMAVFFAGMTVGQRQGIEATAVVLARHGEALEAAVRVQRTGSAYVDALAELETLAAQGKDDELAQGREVAVAALYAAADRLVRLDPEDPVALRLLRGLEGADASNSQEGDGTVEVRRVAWY